MLLAVGGSKVESPSEDSGEPLPLLSDASRGSSVVHGKVLIEALVFVALGALSLIEWVRLTVTVRPQGTYDIFGPDRYQLLVGLALILMGILYFFREQRVPPTSPPSRSMGGTQSDSFKRRAAGSVVAIVVYASLMDILGYLLSSAVFFLLIFWCTGLTRSWSLRLVLSVLFAVVFELVFGRFLGVVFPRGSLIDIGM